MRFQEFGAYAPIEAALWGVAHRDNNRCRDQFSKCPSTAEAFITELNSTPGTALARKKMRAEPSDD
jgi:hypothetical protein